MAISIEKIRASIGPPLVTVIARPFLNVHIWALGSALSLNMVLSSASATTVAQQQPSDVCVNFGLLQGRHHAKNWKESQIRRALRPLALGHVVNLDSDQTICLQKGLDVGEASYDSSSKVMVVSSRFLTVGLKPFNAPQSKHALIAWTSFIHEARHVYQDKIGLSALANVEQPRKEKGGAIEPGAMLNFSIESDAEVYAIDKTYEELVVRQHREGDYQALWHDPNNLYQGMWAAYWTARTRKRNVSGARKAAKRASFIAWFKDGERVLFYTGNYLGNDTSVSKQEANNIQASLLVQKPELKEVMVYVTKVSETALGKLLQQNSLSTRALCTADKVASMAVSRSIAGKDYNETQLRSFRRTYKYPKTESCDFVFYEPVKP